MSIEAKELRAIMKERGLTRAKVAEACGVAEVTVDSWLAPASASLHRKLHPRHLRMLRLTLGMDRPRRLAS